MHRFVSLALLALTGCSAGEPAAEPPVMAPPSTVSVAPPAASAAETATATVAAASTAVPAAPATRKARLGMKDFLTIAGLSSKATLKEVVALWGPGKSSTGKISYDKGPTVSDFSGGLMIDVGPVAGPWQEKHSDGPLSIWGKPCDEAAKMLDFVDKLGGYTTCKHYESDLFLDVTILCHDTVSSVVVVWVPFDPKDAVSPLPADHCNR